MNREFGSTIYKNQDGSYSYNVGRIGGEGGVIKNTEIPEGTTREGGIHTHGGDMPYYDSYKFSDQDKITANKKGQNEYVVTPGGQLLEFDVSKQEQITPNGAATDIPSDPKSGSKRVNDVEAKDTNPYYIEVKYNNTNPYIETIEYNKPNKK